MSRELKESVISFSEGVFLKAVRALSESDILKSLLHTSEDGSLSFSFFYQNEDMENTQISLIVKELEKCGVSMDDYNIRSSEFIVESELYDDFMSRIQEKSDEYYAQQQSKLQVLIMNIIKIKYFEALGDSVYVEYENYDSEHISFSRAKRLLRANGADKIKYACTDNQKSVDFVNSLSFYARAGSDNILIRK